MIDIEKIISDHKNDSGYEITEDKIIDAIGLIKRGIEPKVIIQFIGLPQGIVLKMLSDIGGVK